MNNESAIFTGSGFRLPGAVIVAVMIAFRSRLRDRQKELVAPVPT
jgi:hypothetical protein